MTLNKFEIMLPALLVVGGTGALTAPNASAQTAPPPLVLKTVIPLPEAKGRMDHLSVDIKGRRLFASEIGNGGVAVMNIADNTLERTLTGFSEPQGNYFDDATNRLFVASGDGTVKIFDGTSYRPVATAAFSTDADNVRYDPTSKHVIVGYSGQKFVGGKAVAAHGGEGDGVLGWVDSKGGHGSLLRVDAHPEGFLIQGTRVFINVPDKREIQVSNMKTGAAIARWPATATENFAMTLDKADHRLFIAYRKPVKMVVYDTETGKIVASVADFPGLVDDMFYDAARRRIYAIGGVGLVEVIAQKDPDHYTPIQRVRTPVGSRTGLFVPQLNELFVSISASATSNAEYSKAGYNAKANGAVHRNKELVFQVH